MFIAMLICPIAHHESLFGQCVQNVGKSLGKTSLMTFALNVTTTAPEHADGSLWSTFSPLSKLITIASVNNKAQFEVSWCQTLPDILKDDMQAVPIYALWPSALSQILTASGRESGQQTNQICVVLVCRYYLIDFFMQGDADPEMAAQPGHERRVLGDATDSGLLRFCDKIMDVDDVRNPHSSLHKALIVLQLCSCRHESVSHPCGQECEFWPMNDTSTEFPISSSSASWEESCKIAVQVRAAFSSVFSIPFNSKNKWALNMVRIPGDADNYLVLIKGAPEYVIKKCGRYFYRDHENVLDDDFVEDMMEAYQSFGTLAERVIGHAFKVWDSAVSMWSRHLLMTYGAYSVSLFET